MTSRLETVMSAKRTWIYLLNAALNDEKDPIFGAHQHFTRLSANDLSGRGHLLVERPYSLPSSRKKRKEDDFSTLPGRLGGCPLASAVSPTAAQRGRELPAPMSARQRKITEPTKG